MSLSQVTLHMVCGKIGSGKSTLAKRLSEQPQTVLVVEDEWLSALFGDQMKTGADFLVYSKKLRSIIKPHVVALLRAGTSVVLDFAANTLEARQWMQSLVDDAGTEHALHYLDVPNAVCLARLHARNAEGNHAFHVTDTQFEAFAKHFVAPTEDEGFHIDWHRADA